jgi:hypothetical protein
MRLWARVRGNKGALQRDAESQVFVAMWGAVNAPGTPGPAAGTTRLMKRAPSAPALPRPELCLTVTARSSRSSRRSQADVRPGSGCTRSPPGQLRWRVQPTPSDATTYELDLVARLRRRMSRAATCARQRRWQGGCEMTPARTSPNRPTARKCNPLAPPLAKHAQYTHRFLVPHRFVFARKKKDSSFSSRRRPRPWRESSTNKTSRNLLPRRPIAIPREHGHVTPGTRVASHCTRFGHGTTKTTVT